jgi:hypothetical protein
MDYPPIVGIVSYLGLDPVTVWFEYKIPFLLALVLAGGLLVLLLYWAGLQLRALAAAYRYGFADKQPFYRNLQALEDEAAQARLTEVLSGEAFVFAMPAVAAAEVPGFKKSVGYLVLSPTRLIFTPKEGKTVKQISYPLNSFPDANVLDGRKNIELKLILPDAKPVFQLLGVSRDHAQELFMKMHALRQQLGK